MIGHHSTSIAFILSILIAISHLSTNSSPPPTSPLTQNRQSRPTAIMSPTSVSSSPPYTSARITALAPFKPDLHERAWSSVPHPTLPLIATAHSKAVTVFSLSTSSSHSALTGGHTRSVRSVAWKPNLPPHRLCLVTGSFDSTAGIWRWDGDASGDGADAGALEVEVTARDIERRRAGDEDDNSDAGGAEKDWEFTLVLEGHDSEIKSCVFNPSGSYLATCSRDKSVWIWEDIGASEDDDEWETIAVLNEHEGDVKAVAWCPDVPGRNARRNYSADVLASASYDNTVRIWREDGDAEWVCVAVLEGHEGTVWGLQWEPRPRPGDKFPRLATVSADGTTRLWSLQEEDADADEGTGGSGVRAALGGIPNTMRRSLREEWKCTDILPKAHTRDIYSVAWSAQTGLIASTGSDGIVALYGEAEDTGINNTEDPNVNGQPSTSSWKLLTTLPAAHGPYEVNHVTWCRRYDTTSERRGEEEMLVTTGDDGIVRPWQVEISVSR